MLVTCHLLTGAAISSTLVSPALSLPAAFLSHFILDALPHLEATTFTSKKEGQDYYPTKKEILYIGLDVLVGLFALLFLYLKFTNPLILFGAFFAILPDLIDNIPWWYWIRKIPGFRQFHKFHNKIHFDLKREFWYWGIPFQVALIGAAIWYFTGS